jgi:hypothetical protein
MTRDKCMTHRRPPQPIKNCEKCPHTFDFSQDIDLYKIFDSLATLWHSPVKYRIWNTVMKHLRDAPPRRPPKMIQLDFGLSRHVILRRPKHPLQ